VTEPEAGRYAPGTDAARPRIAPAGGYPIGEISPGRRPRGGGVLFRACDLALAGRVDAVVTAPLNKPPCMRQGSTTPGTPSCSRAHRRAAVSMLLVGPSLRVVHISTHVALREAIARVTAARQEGDRHRPGSCLALGIPTPASRSPG